MSGCEAMSDAQLLDALAQRLAEPIARRVAELLREDHGDGESTVDGWLDSAAAAQYLGLSRDQLRRLAAARVIPSEQDAPGCKRYFRRSALDRWREHGGAPAHLRAVV